MINAEISGQVFGEYSYRVDRYGCICGSLPDGNQFQKVTDSYRKVTNSPSR